MKDSVNNEHQKNPQQEQNQPEQSLGLKHIITSVFAAAFGVQSKKNQQKDFSQKQSIYIYLAAGIIFTVGFVFAVAFVVKLVLANAGA